jgi:hypothetical protein
MTTNKSGPSYNFSFLLLLLLPLSFNLIQFFNKSDPILLYVQTKNEGKNTPGKRPYKQIIIVSIYPTHHLEYGLYVPWFLPFILLLLISPQIQTFKNTKVQS